MSTERIYITWNGKTECYEDNSWVSPRLNCFAKFLRKHMDENETLVLLYRLVNAWGELGRTYEKPLFGYDGLSITSNERMQLTIEGAEKKLQDFLTPYHKDLSKRFSIHRIFGVCNLDYDEYADETDIICSEIADIVGWNIYGNPWNSNLIDSQYMGVSMHRERCGSLKYNWYMEFRNPDLLVSTIDLDTIFSNAREETEEEEEE